MRELRCPVCERANVVSGGAAMERVRCAECAAPLEQGRLVRYRVGGSGRGWGPQVQSDLAFRAEGGSLRRSMLLSEEGGPWFRAGERLDLFVRAPGAQGGHVSQRPQRVGRRPAPVAKQRVARVTVPGSVSTMAALCKLMGVALLLLAVAGFVIAAQFGAGSAGIPVFLFFVLLGWGQLAIGSALLRGSAAARGVQLALAVVVGLLYVLAVSNGAGGLFVVLGGMFVGIPFFLLLDRDAQAWFGS